MRVIVKCGNNLEVFEGKNSVAIGGGEHSDFIVPQLGFDNFLKLIFVPKYSNYVLVNVENDKEMLCNGKNFSKVLVSPKFTVTSPKLPFPIEFTIEGSPTLSNFQSQTRQRKLSTAFPHVDNFIHILFTEHAFS